MADVLVALRWTDPRAGVDPLSGALHAHPGIAAAADRCALEHGLRLAQTLGAQCIAVTAAPAGADGMLRDALACGADQVLRVDLTEDTRLADSGAAVAHALATAVLDRFGPPRLVLAGDRSPDRGTGATPAFLAAEFGYPQALGLLELSAVDGRLTALRRLDAGRRERLAVPLPAVCSVEPGPVRLRRAGLPATLAARTADIPVVLGSPPADERVTVRAARPFRPRTKEIPAPGGDDPRDRLLAITGSRERRAPPRLVVTDDAGEAADELLRFLRDRGYRS